MDKKRVLITYIESGMGHIMSAKSICDSLKKFYGEELDIVESNIMKDSNNKYQIKMEKFLIQQTQWTNKIKGYGFFIFGFIQSFGSQKFLRFTHKTLFKKACDATIEAMKSYNPDCIVSTHYFITYCAIELKKRYLPNLRVVTYNPDNNVHMWWDNRDGIFINNNRLAEIEALKTRKFKYKNLRNVTFTARNDIINENNTKEFYREKYNLPKDKFTVIVADGAYALGRAKTVTNELIKTSKPITILILTGKNEELYDYFKNKKVKSNITLIPMKFTPLAFELYKASDLFITKAGPNAILDSMYMRTPVIVDYYAHPIEKATTKLFIEKYKCGEYIKSPHKIKHRVEEFIEDGSQLNEYRKNTERLNKEDNGADQIAKIIYDEILSTETLEDDNAGQSENDNQNINNANTNNADINNANINNANE